MNILDKRFSRRASNLLSILGNSFRLQILYEIGEGEACVCHLEAVLKKRQPYISQHLSVMRDGGILKTRREGRYIFYRVADLAVFSLVEQAAKLQGISPDAIPEISPPGTKRGCECPFCEPEKVT